MRADGRPALEQFRIENTRNGLIHLVFDMPGRTMNVFSNAAMHELDMFASWLKGADVRGVVVRSGKANAFCAGADLGELGEAYDMIRRTHPQQRFTTAFDHFFLLSRAIRKLETAGKPIAIALGGIALGGGCELAMGGHHRVLVDDPNISLGMPEALVGLMPGAGGTQRMPKLIGIDAALDVMLDGKRLRGRAALEAGLVDELVSPGAEVEAAERWLLAKPKMVQPWDEDDRASPAREKLRINLDRRREAVLKATLGHYPAPLAILDALEFGLGLPIDGAIRTEMSLFAILVQRPEPRNMIRSLFLGRLDYERAVKKGAIPQAIAEPITIISEAIKVASSSVAMAAAGFSSDVSVEPVRTCAGPGYWIDDTRARLAAAACVSIQEIVEQARSLSGALSAEQQRMADFAIIEQAGFPAYLGGPFAMANREVSAINEADGTRFD